MEKDFHYHLIYAISKITGFDEADIIAYSSQFVDDNNEGQFSIDGKESSFPDKIPANGGYYYPIMTQSLSPKSLDIKAMRRKSGFGPTWTEIKKDFRKVINAKDYDNRKVQINNLLTNNGIGAVPRYDKNNWIDAALDKKDEKVVMHTGFKNTPWYHFHQAAKQHFATVLELTREL